MPQYNNGTIAGYDEVPVGQIIAQASNIRAGDNPAFSASDFLTHYPQFKNSVSAPPDRYTLNLSIPDAVFSEILTMANAQIQQARWHSQWKTAMCLFIAHYATLYLRTIENNGDPSTLLTSESVDGVSANYDVTTLAKELEGAGDFLSTSYGQQYYNKARLLGKAGMMVW